MTTEVKHCSLCGSELNLVSVEGSTALYHCAFCGQDTSFTVDADVQASVSRERSQLLSAVHVGIAEWRSTQWDILQKKILQYFAKYEHAANDIRLQMGLVACITSGFQLMDADKYKQCKILFKATERMYKQHLKFLKRNSDADLYESVSDYKELRAKYKKCRNEYRNTKFAWKAAFFLLKKAAFH